MGKITDKKKLKGELAMQPKMIFTFFSYKQNMLLLKLTKEREEVKQKMIV